MSDVVLLRSSTGFYGAERVIVGIAAHLPDFGWQPKLLVLESPGRTHEALSDEATSAGIDTAVVPCHGRLDIAAIRRIREKVATCSGANRILHTHDFKSNLFGCLAAGGIGASHVSTVHGWTSDTVRVRAYEALDRIVLRRADAVIGVSQQIAETLGARVRQYEMIANGVDTDLFAPSVSGFGKEHWRIPGDRFVFGIFARLTREKGHAMLLEAFRRVCESRKDVHLLMTGDGPEDSAIKSRVSKLGLGDRVTIVPAHTHVHRALHDIDCYVSPSITEGMPMIVLEAMASGVPVVATRVGFVPEMLADACGLTVEAGNSDAFAAAMCECMENAARSRMAAERARERVVEHYSVREQSRRHAELYATMASRRGAA